MNERPGGGEGARLKAGDRTSRPRGASEGHAFILPGGARLKAGDHLGAGGGGDHLNTLEHLSLLLAVL